jgi:endonuclease YncB( thermonuclease family)
MIVLRRFAVAIAIVAVALTGFVSSIASTDALSGRVVGVTDGDTITVLTVAHKQVRVRLAEIDAPEKDQPWGQRSKALMSELVFGKPVTIQTSGQDQYGRTLGRVYVGPTNVNAEMVRRGAAWAYRAYLTDRSLVTVETEARQAHLGLWSLPNSQTIPPWDWRRGQRTTQVVRAPRSVSSAGAQCGAKRYCRQMTSCAEAEFYLRTCRVSSLDGDHDGIPCETLCR